MVMALATASTTAVTEDHNNVHWYPDVGSQSQAHSAAFEQQQSVTYSLSSVCNVVQERINKVILLFAHIAPRTWIRAGSWSIWKRKVSECMTQINANITEHNYEFLFDFQLSGCMLPLGALFA